VKPGREYADEIIRGIEQARCFVLVLSRAANESRFVRKEVERAISKDKAIFTTRIENVLPSSKLELFVSDTHWIDAWDGKRSAHLARLAAMIKEQELGSTGSDADTEPDPPARNTPDLEDREVSSAGEPTGIQQRRAPAQFYAKHWPRLGKPAAVIFAVVAVAAAAITFEWRRPPEVSPSSVAVDSTTQPAPVTLKLTEKAPPAPASTSGEGAVAKPVRITAYYVEHASTGLLAGTAAGLHIAKIEPEPDPRDGGLQVGDVILEISGQKVSSLEQAANHLDQAKAQDRSSILFRVSSNSGETHFVGVSLKKFALTIVSATPATGQAEAPSNP